MQEPEPKEQWFITQELIPDTITECSLAAQGSVCTSKDTVFIIAELLKVPDTKDPKEIMDAAKVKLECDTERCVLTKLMSDLGEARVRGEIQANLKVDGPCDNRLLSNVHIDSILRQWRGMFPDYFPYNFNMRNYASMSYKHGRVIDGPDTLATLQFASLYLGTHDGKKYTRAACVINSDVYQGGGKHWMALFVDSAGGTVEFFNSSGNAPAPEWVAWMTKTKNQLDELGIPAKMVRVSKIRHQDSKSECGVYSLFYIWSRLNGVPHERFMSTPVPDSVMFEFRQHLFCDPAGHQTTGKFSWEDYQKKVKIEWES